MHYVIVGSFANAVSHPLTTRTTLTLKDLEELFEIMAYSRRVTAPSAVERPIKFGPTGLTCGSQPMTSAGVSRLTIENDPNIKYAIVIDLDGAESMPIDDELRIGLAHVMQHFPKLYFIAATSRGVAGVCDVIIP